MSLNFSSVVMNVHTAVVPRSLQVLYFNMLNFVRYRHTQKYGLSRIISLGSRPGEMVVLKFVKLSALEKIIVCAEVSG